MAGELVLKVYPTLVGALSTRCCSAEIGQSEGASEMALPFHMCD
nr:MAG TPA: hypothetical protein [Caudoviricetes sp.]